MGKEDAEAALVVWSLEEPLVRLAGVRQVSDLERLLWVRQEPLRENFRDRPPPLTPQEVLRQVARVLKEEGEEPQAAAVVDVSGPILVLLAFDDPRPILWRGRWRKAYRH